MYAEILRIIEGGLNKDDQKVINYSKSLAEKLASEGNQSFAKKILKLIDSQNLNLVRFDGLMAKPLDKESNLETVEVIIPTESNDTLIFNSFIENEIKDFILSYYKRETLLENDIDLGNNIILYGAPGTGKTSLAKYISLQLNLPLIIVKLDGLISSMLGNTAKNIRKVFEYAARRPCVLFLDEFDVIAKVRDDKNDSGELKRVVNSLIQNIDNFKGNSILIAATNHADILDRAIWRRFDKILELGYPDYEMRLKIINSELGKYTVSKTLSEKEIEKFAEITENIAPSVIKLILKNSVKKCIIYEEVVSFYHLLYELYVRENPALNSTESLIEFLYENGLSQKQIAFFTKISLRKVRTFLKKEEIHVWK